MEPAIEIQDLVVEFAAGRQKVQALNGLTLRVPRGHVFGFLGPNGAGKTTTMHVLLGFVDATSGQARVLGQDVRRAIARRRIGYLPEHAETYGFLTGRELLTFAGRLFGLRGECLSRRVETLLCTVELEDAADRRIATYSRGMLQRIGLAQAIVNEPDLVILDEPTSGLDPVGRIGVRALIGRLREEGKTVFFSSHELSEVELVCDTVGILAGGRMAVEGRVSDLLPAGRSLEQYFLSVVRP